MLSWDLELDVPTYLLLTGMRKALTELRHSASVTQAITREWAVIFCKLMWYLAMSFIFVAITAFVLGFLIDVQKTRDKRWPGRQTNASGAASKPPNGNSRTNKFPTFSFSHREIVEVAIHLTNLCSQKYLRLHGSYRYRNIDLNLPAVNCKKNGPSREEGRSLRTPHSTRFDQIIART